MAVAKPANTSPMISASPVSWMRVPAGMFFTAGSCPDGRQALAELGARRHVGADDDAAFAVEALRSRTGPGRSGSSATDDSGTVTPDGVGTGSALTTERSSRGRLVELHPDRDLAVADGELGQVRVDVADGGDAQRLRDRRRRDAEFGQPRRDRARR